MSMATLERAILGGARLALNNLKLRNKDIVEWSTSEITKLEAGEIALRIPDPGVWIAVDKKHDKRS